MAAPRWITLKLLMHAPRRDEGHPIRLESDGMYPRAIMHTIVRRFRMTVTSMETSVGLVRCLVLSHCLVRIAFLVSSSTGR